MTRLTGKLAVLVAELRRRKVVQVLLAYAAAAWVLMQVADLALEAFDAPGWILQAILVLLIIGLPVVVVLTWIFDLTPRGILRTEPREALPGHHDVLSVVLALVPAEPGRFEPTALRTLKGHCERWGALSAEGKPGFVLARFDNAHDALHCALFLLGSLQERLPSRAGLSIGEAGLHQSRLGGDAVDDALIVARHAPLSGLAVSSAYYDSILDRPGSPLQTAMRELSESIDGHDARVYVAEPEGLSDPAVQTWQRLVRPEEVRAGPAVKTVALILLAAMALAIWHWLPRIELPGLAELEPSIAVLPFRDLSQDEANRWFVAGLGEEVLTTLAGITGVRVTSRSTTLDYDSREKDITEIGRQLGVNHLLEGSVNRDGRQIRINLRLSSARDGSLRWAQTYDASPANLINVQRDIAQRVAASLQVALSDAETTRLQQPPTVSSDAYTAYLEAIGYLRQPSSSDSLREAQSRLSRVVASEPTFHDALAALCRTNLQWYRLTQDGDYFELAQQQCGTVLQANRENVGAMLALGQLYLAKGDPDAAMGYFQRGLTLDRNDVELQAGLASALRQRSDPEGAEAMLKQAVQIEPGSWALHSELGSLYLSWGRHRDAVAAFDRAFALVPDNASVLGNLGSAYYYLGEFRKAALAYERSLEFDPTASAAYSNIATLWFFEGSFETAREYYRKAADLTPRDYRVWSNLADAESQLDGLEAESAAHYRDALAMAEDVLTINPANVEALALSAWCAANLGQSETARDRIEEAERLAPTDPNVSYVAATVYAALDHPDGLRRAVEHSLEAGFPEQIFRATPILEGRLLFLDEPQAEGEP